MPSQCDQSWWLNQRCQFANCTFQNTRLRTYFWHPCLTVITRMYLDNSSHFRSCAEVSFCCCRMWSTVDFNGSRIRKYPGVKEETTFLSTSLCSLKWVISPKSCCWIVLTITHKAASNSCEVDGLLLIETLKNVRPPFGSMPSLFLKSSMKRREYAVTLWSFPNQLLMLAFVYKTAFFLLRNHRVNDSINLLLLLVHFDFNFVVKDGTDLVYVWRFLILIYVWLKDGGPQWRPAMQERRSVEP